MQFNLQIKHTVKLKNIDSETTQYSKHLCFGNKVYENLGYLQTSIVIQW